MTRDRLFGVSRDRARVTARPLGVAGADDIVASSAFTFPGLDAEASSAVLVLVLPCGPTGEGTWMIFDAQNSLVDGGAFVMPAWLIIPEFEEEV